MIDQINILIEINLLLIATSEGNTLKLKDFKDNQGNTLQGAKILADIMQQKELIRHCPNEEYGYELTEFGKHIAENGGWLELLKKIKKTETSLTVNDYKKSKSKTNKPIIELVIAGLILAFLSFLIASCI